MARPYQLLDAAALPAFLAGQGVLGDTEHVVAVTALGGGVSGQVHRVTTSARDLVVKQALERLAVAADWYADPSRVLVEGRALAVLHTLTPGHVPALVHTDPVTMTIVMSAAPADWTTWKHRLLAARDDHTVATTSLVAGVLGRWHAWGMADHAVREFASTRLFEDLRLTPFHRAIRARHPATAATVDGCIDELLAPGVTLVHGDLSPKNVLVAPTGTGLWVIDHEVAHLGQPVFDLAFLTCHLLLKRVHLPQLAPTLDEARQALVDGYAEAVGPSSAGSVTARLGRHTACLLLARVDGTSPAAYLDRPEAERVRRLALTTLTSTDPDGTFAALLQEGSP